MLELYRNFTHTNAVRGLIVGGFWSVLVFVLVALSAPSILQRQDSSIDLMWILIVAIICAVAVVNVFLYPIAHELYSRAAAAVSGGSSEWFVTVGIWLLLLMSIVKILLSLVLWLTALPVGGIGALIMARKLGTRAMSQSLE
jgi:hypothetical protein